MTAREDIKISIQLAAHPDTNSSRIYGAPTYRTVGVRVRIRSRHQGGVHPFQLYYVDAPDQGHISAVASPVVIAAVPAGAPAEEVVDLEPGDLVHVVDYAETYRVMDDRPLDDPYLVRVG